MRPASVFEDGRIRFPLGHYHSKKSEHDVVKGELLVVKTEVDGFHTCLAQSEEISSLSSKDSTGVIE